MFLEVAIILEALDAELESAHFLLFNHVKKHCVGLVMAWVYCKPFFRLPLKWFGLRLNPTLHTESPRNS